MLEKFKELKGQSGTHSPSIEVLKKELGCEIKIDACFLSNPYATDLFMDCLFGEKGSENGLRDLFEFYPPQNQDIAKTLSKSLNVSSKNLMIGNGAIELIQAILHRFVKGNISIPIPTFSSYYEFVPDGVQTYKFQLEASQNYRLNLKDYTRFIEENNIHNAVIINPNNPDGGYNTREDLVDFFEQNSHLDNIILDESFIHFAYESDELDLPSLETKLDLYPNVILIKSMAKDFGVAGIRVGYAVMQSNYVRQLLDTGYLWNSNGLAAYFFDLYSNESFKLKYDLVRKKYIMNTIMFINELSRLSGYEIIPTKANFILVRSRFGLTSEELMIELLTRYGIYVRDCSDKIGLEPGYVRIASRRFEDNVVIVDSLKKLQNEYLSV